jgi:hypothetical protein
VASTTQINRNGYAVAVNRADFTCCKVYFNLFLPRPHQEQRRDYRGQGQFFAEQHLSEPEAPQAKKAL